MQLHGRERRDIAAVAPALSLRYHVPRGRHAMSHAAETE